MRYTKSLWFATRYWVDFLVKSAVLCSERNILVCDLRHEASELPIMECGPGEAAFGRMAELAGGRLGTVAPRPCRPNATPRVMPYGRHVVALLAVGGLVAPLFRRIILSPLALVLLFPFFLLFLILGFLAFNILFGYLLDSIRPPPHNALTTAARPLAFSTPAAWQAVLTRSQWSHKAPQTLPPLYPDADRKSTRLNSSHSGESRMPSSA